MNMLLNTGGEILSNNRYVITVVNQKGGVGKSTTVAAVGAALAIRGKKVLLVDLDAQGNLSDTIQADTTGMTAADLLQGDNENYNDAIQHTQNADIISSAPSLANADTIIIETGREYRLRDALESMTEYDYILIDTPPALGVLTTNALTAATHVMIPAKADAYSLQGIGQLYHTITTVKKYCNRGLKILGVVLTSYSGRATISRDTADMIAETSESIGTKIFNTRIRDCSAIKEAQALQKTIFEHAPRSNAAADYNALTDEIETRLR